MSTSPSQYSYGQPAVPPRRSGMTTAGKVLFFIGLVLTVIAVVVGIWGVTRAVQDFRDMADDAVPVAGSATVAMEADDIRFILAPQGTDPACTVTGPSGNDVPVESETAIEDAAASGEGITLVGGFTATEAGDHVVQCDTPAELSPALSISDAVGIGAAGIAFLSLFPLGFITLLGLVLWLVGRNRDKKAAMGPGGYGYSTSSGYGAAEAGYYGGRVDQGQGYGTSYPAPPPPPGSDRTESIDRPEEGRDPGRS